MLNFKRLPMSWRELSMPHKRCIEKDLHNVLNKVGLGVYRKIWRTRLITIVYVMVLEIPSADFSSL
jgi:hypothetical protein